MFWKILCALICEVFELENAWGWGLKAFLFECLVILVLLFGNFSAQ